jgi:hypothetical protein
MTARPAATLDEEVEHLLHLYNRDPGKIMGELQQQLSILANRAQTLLSLAGITITVTGFSGATIARTGRVAATLLVLGLVLVLIAAAIAMTGILRVRWTTSIARCDLEDAVRWVLAARDRKTRSYDRSLRILVIGLSLYVSSIALLLLGNLPR